MKKKIRFIVNPFSGIGKKQNLGEDLKSNLNPDFEYDIVITEYRKHAAALSQEAVVLNYDAVIVVGGDGSVNEAACELINTPVALGIIPGGSGNGVARSLGIPLNSAKAIDLLNNFRVDKIDTGLINKEVAFIGVAGIGFDAHIGNLFLERKIRGFGSYVYVVAREYLTYEAEGIEIMDESGITNVKEAFVVCFANTGQYGNNAIIAPGADPRSGELEMVVISKFPKIAGINIISSLFRGTIHKNLYYQSISAKSFKIKGKETLLHVDGEPKHLKGDILVEVNPKSLNVLC